MTKNCLTWKTKPNRERGAVLMLALLLAAVLGIMVASLLKFSSNETRLSKRAALHNEAVNAAESMVEYGFADLKRRWERQTSFTTNELITRPLAIPASAGTFYGDSNVALERLELVGGVVPPGDWKYIDPDDPANANDPQKGKIVFKRDVDVFGKAVVDYPMTGEVSAHVQQTLQVRDAPLFSHAIFYNMDLEFHPGPQMDIQGPVHSNGDIFVQASRELKFHSTLNASGDILYRFKQDGLRVRSGDILVQNGNGDWVNFHDGSGNNALDSRDSSWRTEATDTWDGNVKSGEHNVPDLYIGGFEDYVPDDPDTAEDETYNGAYAMIEPLLSRDHSNYKGDEIVDGQLAGKAGLILQITESGGNYTAEAYRYQRNSDLDPTSDYVTDSDGLPVKVDLDLAAMEASYGKPLVNIVKYDEDPASGEPVTGSLYDRRQQIGMTVANIDVAVLTDLVNSASDAALGNPPSGHKDHWNGTYRISPGSAVDWNGLVYVELPYDASASARADKVMPADRDVAVRLVNGSEIPNPSFAKSSGYDEGFTFATNGQLYVHGHFNADGDSTTGSSTAADDNQTFSSSEASAALIADAVTILSNNFKDTDSKKSLSSRPSGTFTEVSAAIVSGLVPTDMNTMSIRSGGAHNFPRFLEDWNSAEFRYRGSLVALYESEVATAPWHTGYRYWYEPPTRNWGFHDLFAAGIYPPATPNARDFRRKDFKVLSASEYETALASIDGFDAAGSTRGLGDGSDDEAF
ncbi:MAG: hypothetical protein ACPGKS_06200, partial [Coraliomargarita sp.]